LYNIHVENYYVDCEAGKLQTILLFLVAVFKQLEGTEHAKKDSDDICNQVYAQQQSLMFLFRRPGNP